jgi:hypothetical protein
MGAPSRLRRRALPHRTRPWVATVNVERSRETRNRQSDAVSEAVREAECADAFIGHWFDHFHAFTQGGNRFAPPKRTGTPTSTITWRRNPPCHFSTALRRSWPRWRHYSWCRPTCGAPERRFALVIGNSEYASRPTGDRRQRCRADASCPYGMAVQFFYLSVTGCRYLSHRILRGFPRFQSGLHGIPHSQADNKYICCYSCYSRD